MKFPYILLIMLFSSPVFAENKIFLSHGATQPPMHTEQLTGFIDLVLTKAYERIGIELDITKIENENALISANKGVVDGLTQRIEGLTKHYPNLIRVPEKIIDWQFVAFSKQDINTSEGWNVLIPYTTAIITGWKIFEFNIPEKTNVTHVKTAEQLFNLLDKNRSDIILYERWQGLGLIKKHGYINIKVMNPPIAKREMFTYLHKKHASLVPKLSKALKEIKNDGTYQALYNRILAPLEK